MDRDLEMLLEADREEDQHEHQQEPVCGPPSGRGSIDVDMDGRGEWGAGSCCGTGWKKGSSEVVEAFCGGGVGIDNV